MNRISSLALLAFLFASCQERDSSPAAAEVGIPLGARLVATAPLPNADQVRVRLTIDGEDQPLQFHDYESGKQIELGRAPRNAQLSFDLRAFSVAASDTVWKWFASSSGRADSADHWTFPLALIRTVASAATANLPTVVEPGQVWTLPAGTWYTLDNSDPRTSASRRVARAAAPLDSIEYTPGLMVRAVLRTVVAEGDTIFGESIRIEVPVATILAPGYSVDTTQVVAKGTSIVVHRRAVTDTVEYRRNGVGDWIRDSIFTVDTGFVEARSSRNGAHSAVILGRWTLDVGPIPAPSLVGGDSIDPGGKVQLDIPGGYIAVYATGDTTRPAIWPTGGLTAPDSDFVFFVRSMPLSGGKSSPWTPITMHIRLPGKVDLHQGHRSSNTDSLWFRITTDSGSSILVLRPDALDPEPWISGDSLAVFVGKTIKAWSRRGARSGDTARATVPVVAPPPPVVQPRGGSIRSDETISIAPSIPGDALYYRIDQGEWNRYTTPFLLPERDSVRLEASEVRNVREGFDTMWFHVRAPAQLVVVGGCRVDCDPGSVMTLSVTKGSVIWNHPGESWQGVPKTGLVLDSSRIWRWRSVSESGFDTSEIETLQVRVVQPGVPNLAVASYGAGTAATVRVEPAQEGDSIYYQVAGKPPQGNRSATNLPVVVGDSVKAWGVRGTAVSDTSRLRVSNLARPIPSHQPGIHAPNTILSFTLPGGGLATDEIEVSKNRGVDWAVQSQVSLEGSLELWVRTRRDLAGTSSYSDTLKGIWAVVALRPPKILVPAGRVMALGDSGVRLAELDSNASQTQVRVGTGAWTTYPPGTILTRASFGIADTWIGIAARSIRIAGSGLADTSTNATDSVIIRNLSAPGLRPDSGAYHVDSVVVVALQGACKSCIAQRYDPVSSTWRDLGSGHRLVSPGSQVVRVRLTDSTRTLVSPEASRVYRLFDLPAMAVLRQTPLEGVTRLTISPTATPFTFEILEGTTWKPVAASTGYLVTTSGSVVYRLGHQGVSYVGTLQVKVTSLRTEVVLDAASWNVTLTPPTGYAAQYSVDGGDPTASVWVASKGFALCATGRLWVRSCNTMSVCTAPRETLLVRDDNSQVRAAASANSGFWIDPIGTIHAANASVPPEIDGKVLTGIWASADGGVARTFEGDILPWGKLAGLSTGFGVPVGAYDWSLLKGASDIRLDGSRGMAKVDKMWIAFGLTGSDEVFSKGIDPDLLAKAGQVELATGAVPSKLGTTSPVPYTALLLGSPGEEQQVLVCQDGNWTRCEPIHVDVSGTVVDIRVRGSIVQVTRNDKVSLVYQLTFNEAIGFPSMEYVERNKLETIITPALTSSHLVFPDRSGGLAAWTFSAISGDALTSGGEWTTVLGGNASVVALHPDGRFAHFYYSATLQWIPSRLSEWMAAPTSIK